MPWQLPTPDGPPVRLPPVIDAVVDRWIGLPPRARLVAVLAGMTLALAAASSRATSSPWGPTVDVLVTAVEIPAGAPVTGDVVSSTPWPATLLPADALTELTEGRATARLPAGTVLTDVDVAAAGIAATVTAGHVAIPIPRDLLPELAVGSRLDVVSAGSEAPRTLAAGSRVLGSDERYTWVEVRRGEAADVATAATRGQLAIAVLAG